MSTTSLETALNLLQKFVMRVAVNGPNKDTRQQGAFLADKALAAGVPKMMIQTLMTRLQKYL